MVRLCHTSFRASWTHAQWCGRHPSSSQYGPARFCVQHCIYTIVFGRDWADSQSALSQTWQTRSVSVGSTRKSARNLVTAIAHMVGPRTIKGASSHCMVNTFLLFSSFFIISYRRFQARRAQSWVHSGRHPQYHYQQIVTLIPGFQDRAWFRHWKRRYRQVAGYGI